MRRSRRPRQTSTQTSSDELTQNLIGERSSQLQRPWVGPNTPREPCHVARLQQFAGLCPEDFRAGVLGLPDAVTDDMLQNDDAFLQLYHHALLEVGLEEGALICPETGRRFPVSKGIPNLLLNEDEC